MTNDYWIDLLKNQLVRSTSIWHCGHLLLSHSDVIGCIVAISFWEYNEELFNLGVIEDMCGFYVKVELFVISDYKKHTWIHLFDLFADIVIPHFGIRVRYGENRHSLISINKFKQDLSVKLRNKRYFLPKFQKTIKDRLSSSHFRVNQLMEVVDAEDYNQMRTAKIIKIVGPRLFLTYLDDEDNELYYVYNECSDAIHPIKWSEKIGCKIKNKLRNPPAEDDDLWKWHSTVVESLSYQTPKECAFEPRMLLEFVHPFGNNIICLGVVERILNHGMIRVMNLCSDGELIYYNYRSPYILPPGFCHANGIQLKLPLNYECFDLKDFAAEFNFSIAPSFCFSLEVNETGFEPGMMLEVVDNVEPHLVCVATVIRVVSKLLLVHFIGWEESFDQWLHIRSTDIYPIGWCRAVDHVLELPED